MASRIEIIKTSGDRLANASLKEEGGKGLFTKEIEEALLAGAIDVAVHSLKDLPTEMTPGLVIAATPEREDPRDAIAGCRLSELKAGATVGTSSGRRAAQLRMLRRDLDVQPVRGNVDTRLRKLKEGQFAAMVLATAGLRRLGMEGEIAEIFSPEQMCPAPGQGALAIQMREEDVAREICGQLDHGPTRRAVTCERAALAALGGGCQLPVGAFAEEVEGVLRLIVIVASLDGSVQLRGSGEDARDAEALGRAVGEDLVSRGAGRLLAESR